MSIDDLKNLKESLRKITFPLTVIGFLIGGVSLLIEMILRLKER